MQPIIDVQNLSKKYKIGAIQPRYLSLRDSLSSTFKSVKDWTTFKKLSNLNTNNEFWALKDINFQVNAGESIGIIGRNGAGKSTLLKILSRITPPTSGHAILRGRLASLLEVGTGFHPELTGRENVYFNGSILGLRKAEIDKKFDEIVDFSGVERFIDTPLKNYSSGMQLRLAFAVAAHLEPEILIIDEVLAVGDSIFQQKCIEKMQQISASGNRTLVFVSHNMLAVQQLCKTAFLLENGHITSRGATSNVIDAYNQKTVKSGNTIKLGTIERTEYARQFIFDRITFDQLTYPFGANMGFEVSIRRQIQTNNESNDVELGIGIDDKMGVRIIHLSNIFLNKQLSFPSNSMVANYRFEMNNCELRSGKYRFTLFLRVNGVIQDWLKEIVETEIDDGNPYGFNNVAFIQGVIFPKFDVNFREHK